MARIMKAACLLDGASKCFHVCHRVLLAPNVFLNFMSDVVENICS